MSTPVALLTVACTALAVLCMWRARRAGENTGTPPANEAVASENPGGTAPGPSPGASPRAYRFAGLAALCFAFWQVSVAIDLVSAVLLWVMVVATGRSLSTIGARLARRRYWSVFLYGAVFVVGWVLYWDSLLNYRCTC